MNSKFFVTAPALSACAVAGALAFSPMATAEGPDDCTNVTHATVCGSNSEVATPPAAGAGGGVQMNGQNGPYGPTGNLPPVGSN